MCLRVIVDALCVRSFFLWTIIVKAHPNVGYLVLEFSIVLDLLAKWIIADTIHLLDLDCSVREEPDWGVDVNREVRWDFNLLRVTNRN